MNELKMMGPLFFSDNTWFIDITTSKLQTPITFHVFMELKNSDPSKVYWFMGLRLYLTEEHSIMKLRVCLTDLSLTEL